jgi:hypothetical protein
MSRRRKPDQAATLASHQFQLLNQARIQVQLSNS